MISDKPKFVLKPNLTAAMIPIIISGMIVFIMGMILVLSVALPSGILIIIPIGVFILLIQFSWMVIPRYLDYKKREYRFYMDKLEYFDGWWVINRHVVPFKKVTDITLSKRILDRMMKTGSISLITAGSLSGSISLRFVDNPEEVYEQLQKEILKN